jgi:hypothetical protein
VTAWVRPADGHPGSSARVWVEYRRHVRTAAGLPCSVHQDPPSVCTPQHPCATCEARAILVVGEA